MQTGAGAGVCYVLPGALRVRVALCAVLLALSFLWRDLVLFGACGRLALSGLGVCCCSCGCCQYIYKNIYIYIQWVTVIKKPSH